MPLHKDKIKLYLFSEDINLLDYWESSLKKEFKCELVDEFINLTTLENEIIILNTSSLNNIFVVLEKFAKKGNKVLLLDNIIDFNKAKSYLDCGILGYGNQHMSELFLNSAILSLSQGYVWLHPKITQEMIGQIQNKTTEDKKDEILKNLTKREKQIAKELVKSLTYEQIAQELNISINTLKTHTKKIYEKLNIKDRLSLALVLKG